MSKLLLSISLLLCSLVSQAQKTDSTGFFMMPGITITPFSLGKGYSASTYYSFQFGTYQYPIKGVVRFGFPGYTAEVSSMNNMVDYTIKGAYVQPGFMVYFGNISAEKQVFFMGLLGYFGKYKHHMDIEIFDDYWGTSQQYEYRAETNVNGVLFEMGGMFTFSKKLKGIMSLNTGRVWFPNNPIPQIQDFRNQTTFVPGAGYGAELLIGANFGLHYIID